MSTIPNDKYNIELPKNINFQEFVDVGRKLLPYIAEENSYEIHQIMLKYPDISEVIVSHIEKHAYEDSVKLRVIMSKGYIGSSQDDLRQSFLITYKDDLIMAKSMTVLSDAAVERFAHKEHDIFTLNKKALDAAIAEMTFHIETSKKYKLHGERALNRYKDRLQMGERFAEIAEIMAMDNI